MKMKKVWAILLSASLTAAMFSGCGNSDGKPEDGTAAEKESQQSGTGKEETEKTGSKGITENTGNTEKTESTGITGSAGSAGSAVGQEKADPFGGYETPITLRTMVSQSLTTACPEGIDFQDNPWKRLWAGKGINVEYAAIAADFDALQSKINMAVASGDLPDYINVGYATYQELREADMLADLTDAYETYATDELKRRLYADEGRNMSTVTEDGRIYGIAQPADYKDNGAVVAIRTDWLRELNLKEPESMEELWNIAKAFKENNMGGTCTIGIGATKEISGMLAMRYLINAHGGQTSIWLEKDGGLENSIIQPELKTALSQLHDKYAEGLLDQEYGTKSEPQLFEDAVAGKSGIVVCNFTAPFYIDNGISLGQEWKYFPLYAVGGGYAPTEQSPGFSGCTVVLKECEHPEAVIKLYNMFIKYGDEEPDTYGSNGVNNLAYPAIITETGKNNQIYTDYMKYLEDGTEPEKPAEGYAGTVETCEKWRVEKDPEGRILSAIFGPDSTESILVQELAGGGYLFDAYTGPTGKAALKYGGNLGTLANQMITDIITGARPVDYFDEFVKVWKANGGDEITKEVNDWHQSTK